MKCEVCGQYTAINWGDGAAVVCEEHIDSIEAVAAQKKREAKEWTDGSINRYVPFEVELSLPRLLRVWWAFTWRYFVLLSTVGLFFGLLFSHTLRSLEAEKLVSPSIAEHLLTVSSFFITAVLLIFVFDMLVGKKLGDFKLVPVSTEKEAENDDKT